MNTSRCPPLTRDMSVVQRIGSCGWCQTTPPYRQPRLPHRQGLKPWPPVIRTCTHTVDRIEATGFHEVLLRDLRTMCQRRLPARHRSRARSWSSVARPLDDSIRFLAQTHYVSDETESCRAARRIGRPSSPASYRRSNSRLTPRSLTTCAVTLAHCLSPPGLQTSRTVASRREPRCCTRILRFSDCPSCPTRSSAGSATRASGSCASSATSSSTP